MCYLCHMSSSKHLHSQIVWTGEMQFWQNVHLIQPVPYHVSCVTCHVSQVTCHKSCFQCHMSSSKHFHAQTVRARELKFWQKVHLPQSILCHVSYVMSHVSCVMCHASCVTCHKSNVTCHMSSLKQLGSWNFYRSFTWLDTWLVTCDSRHIKHKT